MLRRNDAALLIRPDRSWPVWFSLLLHGAIFSVCCAIPHGPKVHDCIMVDLQMPRLASPGPTGGRPAPAPPGPGTRGAPAAKTAAPAARTISTAPAPAPAPTAKPQTAPVAQQKTVAAQTPPPSPAGPATVAEGTARGVTGAAVSHGGGGGGASPGSGNASGGGAGSASGGGSGAGGTGGSGKAYEGEFGGQGGPTYLSRVLPVYPRFARRIGKEGTVLLRLTLDESGSLKNVELLEKAGHGFDEAAVTAVRASRFRPALRNGRPVPCRALLPVRFELRE